MKLNDIQIGQRYTYYPPPENSSDLRHFPAVVEAIRKRVKVKVFMEGAEQGVMKHVSAKRLVVHSELQF